MNDPIIENLLDEIVRKVETKTFRDYLANVVDWEPIFHMAHDMGQTLNDKSMLFDKGTLFEIALEKNSKGHIQRTDYTEDGYDNYTTALSTYPGYKIELKSGQTKKDYYHTTMNGKIRKHKKGYLKKKVHRIIKNCQGSKKQQLARNTDFYIFVNGRQAMLIDYETVNKHVKKTDSGMVANVPRELIHVIATTQVDRSSLEPRSVYAKKRKRFMEETVMSYIPKKSSKQNE